MSFPVCSSVVYPVLYAERFYVDKLPAIVYKAYFRENLVMQSAHIKLWTLFYFHYLKLYRDVSWIYYIMNHWHATPIDMEKW